MRRDRLEERTPRNVFGERRPGRERHSPAWTQPAARFGESPVRFGNVVDSEIRYNRVKRLIGKGQDLRIALLEADPGMIGARQCDHRRGKIEPHRQRPAPDRRRRYEPRSAGQVEHTHSCSDPSGVEQILNKTACRLREGRGVVRSRLLPTGVLEDADGLRIEGHHSAAAARAKRSARSRWHVSAQASTAATTAGSAVPGEPDAKGGAGAYSMPS